MKCTEALGLAALKRSTEILRMTDKNLYENMKTKLLNNFYVALLLIAFPTIVGLATFTDSLSKISNFLGPRSRANSEEYSGERKSHAEQSSSPITASEFFSELESDSKTDLQLKKFIESHVGRKVSWEGQLGSVDETQFPPGCVVAMTVDEDGSRWPHVAVVYFAETYEEDLWRVDKGDHISVTGILNVTRTKTVTLTNAHLSRHRRTEQEEVEQVVPPKSDRAGG